MKIFRFASGTAAALALVTTLAAVEPAAARDRLSPGAAAAIGVLGGLAVGGAIAASQSPVYAAPAPVYVAPPPPPVLPIEHFSAKWIPVRRKKCGMATRAFFGEVDPGSPQKMRHGTEEGGSTRAKTTPNATKGPAGSGPFCLVKVHRRHATPISRRALRMGRRQHEASHEQESPDRHGHHQAQSRRSG
jgi:hypothetical protein